MNLDKLKQAEEAFLSRFPGGFQNPDMQAIGKKHNVNKMVEQTQAAFRAAAFRQPMQVLDDMTKLVSRASMVSMFEKPKFRDFVHALPEPEKFELVEALRQQLHGKQPQGFAAMRDVLDEGKLAKWSLMTILPNYFRPFDEVFVKPTTAKGVIALFELKGLEYKPRPSWEFYAEYRRQILAMRAAVDPSLAPSNAAFGGFLMMSLRG